MEETTFVCIPLGELGVNECGYTVLSPPTMHVLSVRAAVSC